MNLKKVISGFSPYQSYNASITASTIIGAGPPAILLQEELNQIVSSIEIDNYSFDFTVPTAPPINCTNTTFFSRNVTLSWIEPVRTGQNGRAVGYNLNCTDNLFGLHESVISKLTATHNSAETVFTINDISPYSSYTCNLSFINNVGEGPTTQCSFATAQGSK